MKLRLGVKYSYRRSRKLEQKSVTAEVKRLKQGAFKHRRIGTLHGKMKDEERQSYARVCRW
jgi:RecG-like helicase